MLDIVLAGEVLDRWLRCYFCCCTSHWCVVTRLRGAGTSALPVYTSHSLNQICIPSQGRTLARDASWQRLLWLHQQQKRMDTQSAYSRWALSIEDDHPTLSHILYCMPWIAIPHWKGILTWRIASVLTDTVTVIFCARVWNISGTWSFHTHIVLSTLSQHGTKTSALLLVFLKIPLL